MFLYVIFNISCQLLGAKPPYPTGAPPLEGCPQGPDPW